MSSLSAKDVERRATAKRANEGIKLVANFLNALAVATLGAAFLLPALAGGLQATTALWILLALALHFAGQAALRRLRSED
jgi:hypothetical protein